MYVGPSNIHWRAYLIVGSACRMYRTDVRLYLKAIQNVHCAPCYVRPCSWWINQNLISRSFWSYQKSPAMQEILDSDLSTLWTNGGACHNTFHAHFRSLLVSFQWAFLFIIYSPTIYMNLPCRGREDYIRHWNGFYPNLNNINRHIILQQKRTRADCHQKSAVTLLKMSFAIQQTWTTHYNRNNGIIFSRKMKNSEKKKSGWWQHLPDPERIGSWGVSSTCVLEHERLGILIRQI